MAGGGWKGRRFGLEHGVERIQSRIPELLVVAQPRLAFGERLRLQVAEMGAPPDLPRHQPGALQHLDVLGGRRERDMEGGCQFAHAARLPTEAAQHAPAGAVGEGVEDGIEPGGFMFNHVVEYWSLPENYQPFG